MLDNSVTSHDVAEQYDVERLELATDNLLNSQENFVEGRWVCFWRLVEIFILHACTVSKSYNRIANFIVELMCGIQCRTIKATKVRCRYALVNTYRLYVNILEYIELLDGLIFDRPYRS